MRSSFLECLRKAREATAPPDPWTAPLRDIRGQMGHDGVERLPTDAAFEYLDIPRLKRTPDVAKRLKLVMLNLGWTPVRARCATSRGRASRVRGYARMKQPVRQQSTEDDTIKPSNR